MGETFVLPRTTLVTNSFSTTGTTTNTSSVTPEVWFPMSTRSWLRERVSSQTLLPRLRPSFVFSTRLLLLDTLLRRPVESLPMESNLSLTFQLLELGRSQVAYGSAAEVTRFEELVGKK